jgi:hypothetical protein
MITNIKFITDGTVKMYNLVPVELKIGSEKNL